MKKLLPPGRHAGVCFTIDDVSPSKAADAYDCGGDLGNGALRHVERLLARHSRLRVTLFTTPDWRMIQPQPTRKLLASIPFLRERCFLSPVHASGFLRLSRHPAFVEYLRNMRGVEIGIHGLHHVHPGHRMPVEFQNQSAEECLRMLRESMNIFEEAGLPYVSGMTPPGWNLPVELASAMVEAGLTFVASARDTETAISARALTAMSGLRGVSLLYPEAIGGGRLLHFPVNFQATSPMDRALAILENGGLLSIKAHIVKQAFGYTALDGLDELYCNYLDVLFSELERRYGDALWWTSMGDMASRWAGRPQEVIAC